MEFAPKQTSLGTSSIVLLVSAALVFWGNGLTPWWPLMWLAPFPLLWFSLRTSWVRSFCIAAGAWLVGSLNLITYFRLQGTPLVVWLADFGSFAIMAGVGVLLFRALVHRGAPWCGILAMPALWVSSDWLRYGITPHGTSADLAYTQLGFLPFLQLASLTGPWGMTFLLLLIPAATAACLHLRTREPRQARKIALVIGAIFGGVLVFGALRLAVRPQPRTVTVGLIASDVPQNVDVADSGRDAQRLLKDYAQRAATLVDLGATVIVLPEKIAAVRDSDDMDVNGLFQPLVESTGVTVVVGELHLSRTSGGVSRFNRAAVFTPGSATGTYDKEHLLPPFESNITPGTAKLTERHGDALWGIAICKDMDFTSMGNAYGNMRAGLMLVPAWDFNLDRIWHGHMAIMRGVEGGFSVARAAKNGSLYASDDRGRILAETRTDSAPFATLVAQVPVGHDRTLFQWWGNWFAWLAVAVLGIVVCRLPGLGLTPRAIRPAMAC